MGKGKAGIPANKGFNDILPGTKDPAFDAGLWDTIEGSAANILQSAAFCRVKLPVVEPTPLYCRGIGEGTDIVGKEMYSFTDRGGRSLTLRPEGTAGAARAYVQHHKTLADTVQRWWYCGPMYRAERPQKGRYRQFYQIGAEAFGCSEPTIDAELISLLRRFCDDLGLKNASIHINSLGDDATRAAYRDALQNYLRPIAESLCEPCASRIEHNPLRVLDCKRPLCKEAVADAPTIDQHYSPDAARFLARFRHLLDGLKVETICDPRLVRGLDYYTGPVFEFREESLGAQDAILGGGRYDNLVQELGGPACPAVGFAAGIERLALAKTAMDSSREEQRRTGPDLYIATMADDQDTTATFAVRLAAAVRTASKSQIVALVDASGGKLKAQLRRANRCDARFALVLGENEVTSGCGALKNLTTGESVDLSLNGDAIIAALVNKRLAPPSDDASAGDGAISFKPISY